ncbi:unnamed protein product [Ilex paraguariensis]|uniref:Uncharacterized protein n=1 Tax=Ilex paraguariensis TaxID=185542 RepID=A0ABC8SMN8_9AQUA
MQASSGLWSSSTILNSYSDEDQFAGKIMEGFSARLKIVAACDEIKVENSIPSDGKSSEDQNRLLNKQQSQDEKVEDHAIEEEQEDGHGDEDFSFVCSVDELPSPISADDVFQNGQIKPVFPLFGRDLLLLLSDEGDGDSSHNISNSHVGSPVKKFFIETNYPPLPPSSESDEINGVAAGPYCDWSKGKTTEKSPEVCKKSNSTGFSKLWRFGDFYKRSHSDGRDAFVFMNNPATGTAASKKTEEKVVENRPPEKIKSAGEVKINNGNGVAGGKVKAKTTKKGVKPETSSLSAYLKNRAAEEDRRRSYLPYRPELVGFFTNVNGGLSRNVHPF